MSIENAVGTTYTGAQVSIGSMINDGVSTLYTASTFDSQDSLSVTSVNGDTVGFTYTSANENFSGFATVIANSGNSFILSYVNGSASTNFLVSNNAQIEIPSIPAIDEAFLPDEYAAPIYQAPCYCPGTLIRTERGDVPVEELAIGDRLVTTSGALEAVRWIGTRSYAGRFLAAHPALRPVRFRTGSLGMDEAGHPVPSRDLLVSPKHAMLIDGVLVPAELLVNDATILRDAGRDGVSYIHVELAEHHAIWAENAASETFVDDGSRAMFHNAATFLAMYPQSAVPAEPVFCAPRVEHGPLLETIRRRLAPAPALAA